MSPQFYSLHPSLTLRILIWLVHLAALAILLVTTWASRYQTSALLVLPSLWWQLRSRVTLRQLVVHQDLLECLDSINRRYQAKRLARSWVGAYVIFLQVQDLHSQKKIIHAIAFDAMPADDFRRLRVALRLLG
ncbi:MAG: protein YgfX [Gallionella sp.]